MICWQAEKALWQEAVAHAQGGYARGVSNMLAAYIRLGRPDSNDTSQDSWIYKHYLKLHNAYVLRLRIAGNRWLFETQGYSHDMANSIVDLIVAQTEGPINNAQVNAWLWSEVY